MKARIKVFPYWIEVSLDDEVVFGGATFWPFDLAELLRRVGCETTYTRFEEPDDDDAIYYEYDEDGRYLGEADEMGKPTDGRSGAI